MPTIEETPKPIFQEVKITIPTKETIERELSAQASHSEEALSALRSLGQRSDMDPTSANILGNQLSVLDSQWRKAGILMHQKYNEIEDLQREIRVIKLLRGRLIMDIKQADSHFIKMHEDEERYRKEQEEMKEAAIIHEEELNSKKKGRKAK